MIDGAWCLPTLNALIGLISVWWPLSFKDAVGDDLDLILARQWRMFAPWHFSGS